MANEVEKNSRKLTRPTPDLLTQMERHAHKVLEPLFGRYLDTVQERLLQAANSEENLEHRAAYTEAQREFLSKRSAIERDYLRRIEQPLRDFMRAGAGGADKGKKLSLDSLSLLDDQNLEESLTLNTIAERLKSTYAEEVDGIQDVLGRLNTKVVMGDSNNPLSPKNIVDALRLALEPVHAPLAVRLTCYKLFDSELAAQLSPLYVELDHLLVSRNLIDKERSKKKINNPEVKAREKNKEESKGEGKGSGKDKDENNGGDSGGGELVDAMQDLVSSGTFGGAAHQGPIAAPVQVSGALNAFQSKALSIPAGADPQAIGNRVKEQLGSVVQKMTGDASLGVSQMDNAMIDVVSMIFEYILEDPNIPDSVKALISRLQIPMLKVAIIDRGMFGNRDHPARRMLNTLARAGLDVSDQDTEKTSSTLHAISAIVHRVLSEFKDDVSVFERLLEAFEKFVEAKERKEQAAEAKAAREAQTREEIQLGQEEAERLIGDALADHPQLPKMVSQLLDGPWRKALVQAAASEGRSSLLWEERAQLVRDLIRSVIPIEDPAERKKLGQQIPKLVLTLREGLSAVHVPEAKITALLTALEPVHVDNISGKAFKKIAPPPAPEPAPEQDKQAADAKWLSEEDREFNALLAQTEQTLASLEDELEAPPPPPEVFADWSMGEDILKEFGQDDRDPRLEKLDPATQPDDDFLEAARDVEIGQYLYVEDTTGERVRAKCGWKSDYLEEYSFMNWKFKVVAEMSLYHLAAALREGKAAVIEKAPLMERALEAVTSLLKRKKAPAEA